MLLRLTILLCQDHPLLIVLGAELAERAEPSLSVDLLHDSLDNISKGILEIFFFVRTMGEIAFKATFEERNFVLCDS